ncbi:hypothetical protein KIH39_19780 [Telmatocola sphagniphila]|uniref:Uncharacterized protein n=1 Tax=Telmatocola sphagniphila TaxID=1123043 RepID=A0A8E6B5W0_9BACT|nr:hypothetical protein [Telmatocola sphagniphila]QVL31068.1 hypothetical protein KIH39_19780 [Telmatocola sphagniphila]
MGLLSKILLVLNLLAAGAFIYLASSVWGKRQEWTYSVFRHTIALKGLPLEGESGTGSEDVPFDYQVNDQVRLNTIRKSTLQKAIPSGGSEFGGEPVNSQTAELKRLQQKIFSQIDGADGNPAKLNLILKYLLNLAQTGAHRDGAFALLRDILNPARVEGARIEIGLLARTPSQVDALKALAAIGDKGGAVTARRAILDLLKSTAPLGISGDSADARAEAERSIRNAVLDVEKAAGTDTVDRAGLENARKKLNDLINNEDIKTTLNRVIELLAAPLNDAAQAENARKSLRDIVVASARSESERNALNALAEVLMSDKSATAENLIAAGKAVLQVYFDEAEAPATLTKEGSGKKIFDPSEKAAQIAHILIFIDADKPDFSARWDWQQRVMAIVGMKRYVESANTQAIALADMAQRLRGILREEESVFRANYADQSRSATLLGDQLSGLNLELSGVQNQKNNQEANLNDRTRERENLERNLEDNKVSAKKFLADLAEREKELFGLLQQLNTSRDDMFRLEQQLRKKEQELKK